MEAWSVTWGFASADRSITASTSLLCTPVTRPCGQVDHGEASGALRSIARRPRWSRETDLFGGTAPGSGRSREIDLFGGTAPGSRTSVLAWRHGPEPRGVAHGALRSVERHIARGHGTRRSPERCESASSGQGTPRSSERGAPHPTGQGTRSSSEPRAPHPMKSWTLRMIGFLWDWRPTSSEARRHSHQVVTERVPRGVAERWPGQERQVYVARFGGRRSVSHPASVGCVISGKTVTAGRQRPQ